MSALWDKLNEETETQYRAFVMFCHLPIAERSLRQAEKATGHSINTIRMWSSKFKWSDRVSARDVYEMEINRATTSEIQKNNQTVVIEDGFVDYERLIEAWQQQLLDTDDMSITKLDTLIRMRVRIDTLGRRATQLPVTHQQVEHVDTDKKVKLEWSNTPALIKGNLSPDSESPVLEEIG